MIRRNLINKQTIVQCRKGNKKAQKALYKAYTQKMFMHCYSYIAHKQDTEDVLSEGFIKVFNNLSKVEYRDAKSFEGWIKKIMVNESLMFLRKRKMIVYDEKETLLANTEPIINTELEAKDIYNLILTLPIGYRTVFNLHAIEGFSHKEIAKMLDIGESTSRSQLTKAREKLKKLMVKTNI